MNTPMPDPRCPECGAPLTPGAALGLCARCLLAGAAEPTEQAVPRSAPPSLAEVASAFPQLEVVQMIGHGGMGAVFQVLDRWISETIFGTARSMSSPSDAFHTTRWTLERQTRGTSPEARAALSELCAAYYAPVVAFLRREGRDDDAARELAHGFFARVLADDALGEAERGRGRFRSYLLGAVKHFLANARRDAARESAAAARRTSPSAQARPPRPAWRWPTRARSRRTRISTARGRWPWSSARWFYCKARARAQGRPRRLPRSSRGSRLPVRPPHRRRRRAARAERGRGESSHPPAAPPFPRNRPRGSRADFARRRRARR